MVEKKKEAPKVRRFVHEDEPEVQEGEDSSPSTMQPLYSVGAGAPLAKRRAAAATTERDRQALKDKTEN